MSQLKSASKAPDGGLRKAETPFPDNKPRAVAYVRMSTDHQEQSPERQREQIEAYAKKQGYSIREVYSDLGIPGDERSRPEFVRLMADARGRKFDVILIDEPSRLSRTSPLQFIAEVVYPLEENKISVESVSTGQMRWDDLAGLILTIVLADSSCSEVKNMSRRTLDGLARSVRASNWNSSPPFGFKVQQERDPTDPRKPVSRRLVPGDPQRVAAVQWMFATYAKSKCGMREIALQMASRGLFGDRYNGKQRRYPVSISTISAMLRNPVYVGDLAWNKRSFGKYSKLVNGKAEFRPKSGRNPKSDWIIVPNAHQGLVTRSIFQAVEKRLDSNPKKPPVDRPREPYKLSKLLTCGGCNGGMFAWTQKQNSGWVKKYACLGNKVSGRRHCHFNSVDETAIVDGIVNSIQKTLANGGIGNESTGITQSQQMKLASGLVILDQGSASQARALFGQLFDRIVLHFKYTTHRKAKRSILCGGDIFLKRSPHSETTTSPTKFSFAVS